MAKYHILGLFAILFLTHSILAAEVKLGPEVPLSDIKLRPAPFVSSSSLTAASNGHDFRLAWQELMDIFVARVGVDGRPADPLGRHTIATGTVPKLARAGSGYLLVWRASSGIQSQRLDENGAPLSAPRAVTVGSDTIVSSWSTPIALLSNGSNYLLVYSAVAVGGSVVTREMLLDSDGAPLMNVNKEEQVVLGAGVRNGRYVVIASSQVLTLHTIADDGIVSDTPLPRAAVAVNAVAVFGPNSILFAWAGVALYSVLGYDGSLIKIPVQLPVDTNSRDIAGGWDGHQFLLTFSGREAFRVASDGTLLDAAPFSLSQRSVNGLRIATTGTDLLAAWSESFGFMYSNVARVVTDFDALAAVHDPANVISFVEEAQTDVQIARGPKGVFAVWNDPTRYEVWAAINGVPRLIDRAVSSDWAGWPSVAAGEQGFLVAWRHNVQSENDRVFARRFDFDGEPVDPRPILLDSIENFGQRHSHTAPSIAFDGSSFLVAWSRIVSFGSGSLNIVRIGEVGEPFDVRAIPVGLPLAARSLWTGSEFLVAYTFDPFWGLGVITQYMALARIDRSSNVLSQSPPTTFTDNGIASVGVAATVVPGRVTYAWVDRTYSIAVAQTTFDGQVLRAPRVIVQRADGASSADIVWDGSEFVLTWPESIGNTTGRKLRAIRLDTDLRPIDLGPFDIFSEPGPLSNPSLITTPAGVTIAYSRYDSASSDTARVFTRTLDRRAQKAQRRAVGH